MFLTRTHWIIKCFLLNIPVIVTLSLLDNGTIKPQYTMYKYMLYMYMDHLSPLDKNSRWRGFKNCPSKGCCFHKYHKSSCQQHVSLWTKAWHQCGLVEKWCRFSYMQLAQALTAIALHDYDEDNDTSERQGCTNCGSRVARKWRGNEKMKRKWRENEELERDSLSTFPHFLSYALWENNSWLNSLQESSVSCEGLVISIK